MGKSNWKSQQVLANELGVSVQVICNWVRRQDKRIKSKYDENTRMTLVKWVGEKK